VHATPDFKSMTGVVTLCNGVTPFLIAASIGCAF
jgi:hypothetical protein